MVVCNLNWMCIAVWESDCLDELVNVFFFIPVAEGPIELFAGEIIVIEYLF